MWALSTRQRAGSALTMSAMFIAFGGGSLLSTVHQQRERADGAATLPPRIPNSVPYRAQSYVHGSNRSGDASLTGRALLSKDGSTSLELTTGQLDVAGAPGSIVRVQAKLLDANKVLQTTQNYNGANGGVEVLNFAGRPRHSFIQAQANIRGIDPNRTDVVTIVERVNRRPDIAVLAVDAADKAPPSTPVVVSATLGEMNGDLGAHANCVLYVNGSEADRANGIWIADGDHVSCAFTTSFASPGNYLLEVKAENVAPGDWDTANNSLSRRIDIVAENTLPLSGTLSVSGANKVTGSVYTDQWSSSTGADNVSKTNEKDYSYQSVSLYANSNKALSFPLQRLRLTQTSGTSTVLAIDQANVSPGSNGCVYVTASAGAGYVMICPNKFNYATWLFSSHYAGVTTYYSRGFDTGWDSFNGTWNYSWNDTTAGSSSGKFVDLGATYAADVYLQSANGDAFTAKPSLTLTNSPYNHDGQVVCTDVPQNGYTDHYCTQTLDHGNYFSGFVSF